MRKRKPKSLLCRSSSDTRWPFATAGMLNARPGFTEPAAFMEPWKSGFPMSQRRQTWRRVRLPSAPTVTPRARQEEANWSVVLQGAECARRSWGGASRRPAGGAQLTGSRRFHGGGGGRGAGRGGPGSARPGVRDRGVAGGRVQKGAGLPSEILT